MPAAGPKAAAPAPCSPLLDRVFPPEQCDDGHGERMLAAWQGRAAS